MNELKKIALTVVITLIIGIALLIFLKVSVEPIHELLKIALTASFTLIGGTLLLLLSKIFVEPIHELRKIIGEIAAYVFKSHNLLTNVQDPNENELKITIEKLQEFSAKFRALINIVTWFHIFVYLKLLPPKDDLLKAAGILSKISYAPSESNKGRISEQIKELYSLLKFNMHDSSISKLI